MTITLSSLLGGCAQLWVSGRTYEVGQQAISPTAFTTFIRKTAGAGAVDPASDTTNWQPFGGRAIKAIQRGDSLKGSGSILTSVTISPVVMAKTEVRFLGGAEVVQASNSNRVILTTPTTLVVYGNSTTSAYISWELTEYY